jgi:hypothetical protein
MFHCFFKKAVVVWPLIPGMIVAGAGLADACSLFQSMLTH